MRYGNGDTLELSLKEIDAVIVNLKDKRGNIIIRAEYVGKGTRSKKNNELLVLPGSLFAKRERRNVKWKENPWVEASRIDILKGGYLDDYSDSHYIFRKKYVFTSPNKALSVCLGVIVTYGWTQLINNEGKSLNKIFAKENGNTDDSLEELKLQNLVDD